MDRPRTMGATVISTGCPNLSSKASPTRRFVAPLAQRTNVDFGVHTTEGRRIK